MTANVVGCCDGGVRVIGIICRRIAAGIMVVAAAAADSDPTAEFGYFCAQIAARRYTSASGKGKQVNECSEEATHHSFFLFFAFRILSTKCKKNILSKKPKVCG